MPARLFASFGALIAVCMACLVIASATLLAASAVGHITTALGPYWLELVLGGYAILAAAGLVSGAIRPSLRRPALIVIFLCIADITLSLALRMP